MNLETRDQLDTHLDDAKQALRKARAALVRSGMTVANDWTILGALSHASAGIATAIEALPTVHNLQSGEPAATRGDEPGTIRAAVRELGEIADRQTERIRNGEGLDEALRLRQHTLSKQIDAHRDAERDREENNCLACAEGVGRHAIDCPKAARETDGAV